MASCCILVSTWERSYSFSLVDTDGILLGQDNNQFEMPKPNRESRRKTVIETRDLQSKTMVYFLWKKKEDRFLEKYYLDERSICCPSEMKKKKMLEAY